MKCDFCEKKAINMGMSMNKNRKMVLTYVCDKDECLEELRKPFKVTLKCDKDGNVNKMFP